MRKVLNNKVYNTATAKEIAKVDHRTLGELHWFLERLYRTRGGDYMLLGIGGDLTRWMGEIDIVPFTREQAAHWAQKHGICLEATNG